MATQELEITPETVELLEIIGRGENFLLSGGAGSGKTYSLVETIREVLKKYPLASIACITYTNAAVREIEDRIDHHNLHVSTIHDFLWDNIKHYQEEVKFALLNLINDEDDRFKSFKLPGNIQASTDLYADLEKGIQYKEYLRLKDGIISHDELIVLAWKMYSTHKRLCGITKDRFPLIFVDEYQDTSKYVIEILLEHFQASPKPCVIGFFGDAMQSIYDGSIGDLDAYKGNNSGQVKEVRKEQNRRNPRLVINLANELRTDGIIQRPSNDLRAPNMLGGKVKIGTIQFIFSGSNDLNCVRDFLKWENETKELNLTHNLIAGKAGFGKFMEVYNGDKILTYVTRIKNFIKASEISDSFSGKTLGEVIDELKAGKTGRELTNVEPTPGMNKYIDAHNETFQMALTTPYSEIASIYIDKDQLLDDKKNDVSDISRPGSKRDDLIKHLFKVQRNLYLYKKGMINSFIRATDFRINSIRNKKELKSAIDSLINVGDKTIAQVIEEANKSGICKIDDKLIRFQQEKEYVYEQVKNIPFSQFQSVYDYLEGHSPFSTQHKTKGAEYPNVLIILDNGNWSNYNFKNLFEGMGKESVLKRTQKIFYVCCTRAKENLAVFYHNPPSSVIAKAKEWFGEENVIDLDSAKAPVV